MVALLLVIDDDARPAGCAHAGGVPLIVKFTLLISKKIFPTASIFTLHCEPGLFGTVIFSVPSFGVLAASVMGKLFPPSVESRILTVAQLTGATLVEFTLQVTVCVEPTVH